MLQRFSKFPGVKGPLVIVVMDGYGIAPPTEGNAIALARKPILDGLLAKYPNTLLKAHGKAVGLPSDDDMGNSEVGHNAIGAGAVYEQGASLVNQAIASGKLFERQAWKDVAGNAQRGGTLHFLGLFSDGNVHSHINHLTALIKRAKQEGARQVRVHVLLDGRDVGETSALDYVLPFEKFLKEISDSGFDARIASGGGRMKITMDRYEADWSMVERGWKCHVLAEGRSFASAEEAINTLRSEAGRVIDQDLPPFVIAKDGKPVGPIVDGDSVVFFNFRGDRAIEISRAFEDDNFPYFDRKRRPKVVYAGMLEYDGDLHIPKRYLVAPPEIKNTMGEQLASMGISQLAISETQKFGHVTYFWNGNRSGKFDDKTETYIEIPSDRVSFDERPWMKAAEITDAMIEQIKTGKYRCARMNYANGDMVGHTGNLRAATMAVEAVDLELGRLLPVIDAMDGMAIITADHGNADEMLEMDKKTGKPALDKTGHFKAKTSHTLNPVPCIFYGKQALGLKINGSGYGLSDLAATTANLLGYQPSEGWDRSILSFD
ncbi:MAG: 2,3-bisphosphoglycerate-independent phosphoglycerate mutase [Fibrobacteres bacterium]|nr:2,3-bisphosphoglycerate-independent phosphoglycerate mutase [Fibrobacterota bacterium]